MRKSIDSIFEEKKQNLERLKLSIEDNFDDDILSENNDIGKLLKNSTSVPFKTDRNKFLEKLKTKKKTNQLDLNKSANSSTGFISHIRNNLLFRVYFPSLLYSSDRDTAIPESATFQLVTEGTSLNRLVKATTGIVGAWIITYFAYLYLRYHLRTEVTTAIPLLITLFIVFLMGLSFSNPKFRCITLLIIPFMATNRGSLKRIFKFIAINFEVLC